MPRRLTLAFALLAAASPLPAAQPQFWRLEGARDFLDGDTEALTVDSEGRLHLAPTSRLLHDTESPYVWCLAIDGKGTLYAGTGNDGRVFRIEAGKASLFFDAPELEVHALAVGPDGRVYVGTSPDGKIYAVDGAGKAETFYDPADKYVWALAFDKTGNLFVATGAEARVHRVDSKGTAQVVLTTPETHVLTLAFDGKGNLYAGSAPGGIIYRIDPSLKVFVVHDSAYREVKALDTGADGSVYAAVVDGGERSEPARVPTPIAAPVTAPAPMPEVTVTESFSVIPPAPASPGVPRTMETPRPGTAKGAVLRILPTGEVDTLWSSAEEMPHSLVRSGEGGVWVGTGNKGKLYRINDDRTWSMLASFPADQLTGLGRHARGGVFIATANPGKVYAVEDGLGERGTFTSKVKDTDAVSSWGRLRWEAQVPTGTEVEVRTRSGNTSAPDSTWSDWSTPYRKADGEAVTSERARFLQVRVVITGKAGKPSPVLDSVTTGYLQRNLRPRVESITVHPPGEVFQKPISISGDIEVLGLEPGQGPDRGPVAATLRPSLPPATTYSRKLYQKGIQTFSWKAEDPNADTLIYDVHYRAVSDRRFRRLRKGLTDPVVAWDTSTVPNGRYVVRVSASDAPSNPPALALTADKESAPFEVDNTPPAITATLVHGSPARIRAQVKDDSSIIRRTEYSADGSRWEEVYPTDGINDSQEESYEIVLTSLPGPAPHIVVVRAMDQLGNVATARVEVP